MRGGQSIDAAVLVSELEDGVFVARKTGEIVFCNPALSKMLGYTQDSMALKSIPNDIADRSLEWKALISLLEQGTTINDYEIKFRRLDGKVLVMALTATVMRGRDGALDGIAAVARDISTRKGVEKELREKAFRIDIMNRIARLTGTHKDVRTVLTRVSDSLRELVDFETISVGVTEEKGRHVEVFVPDQDNPDKAKAMGKVPYEGSIVEKLRFGGRAVIVEKEAGKHLFTEFQVLDVNRASSFIAVPLTSRGRVLGSVNLLHTKQAEYDWESAESLQMLADLLAGMIDSMVLFGSLDSKVRLQEALVRSGVELQRAISKEQIYSAIATHIREIVPYKDLSFYVVDAKNRKVVPVYAVGGYSEQIITEDSGGFEDGIVGHVARTGRAEFVDDVDTDPRSADIPGVPAEHDSMLAIPLTGTRGVLGVLELYRERGQVFTQNDLEAGLLFAQQASVSLENAQLVSKLQDAKKEIELLNDLMFHDINNYNFATLNYVQTVARSDDISHEHKESLEKSLHLIRETARLIDNVKKLTKIGIMEPEDLALVNLSDVLRKVVSATSSSSPSKRVSIKLDVPEEAYVRANPLVEELFINLLNNSVKYDPHEEVEIDVEMKKVLEEDRAAWKVCISDNGYGIPDEKKQLLFRKYVRLKPDTKVSGSGLGLSICRELADKFSARIWVEDRVPGKSELGARFCVAFPAEAHSHR